MAIYHASTTTVSRGAGHSSCAKSAYIGGDEITNEVTGEIHNYENRHGVEHNEIILPSGINEKITPQELWNKAEKAEVRKDARVGREWNIALPHEITAEQRKELAQDIAQDIANRYQVATQLAIHAPSETGDERNHHAHILTTTRKIDKGLNLTDKADIELSNKKCISVGIKTTDEQIKDIREMIATKTNQHLEKAQIKEQVTHKSYQDQGIAKIPTKHMGKSATHLERKGKKTSIGEYNRSAIRFNELKKALGAITSPQLVQSPQPPQENAADALKSAFKPELNAGERAMLFFQKQKEDIAKKKNKSADNSIDDQKNEILSKILSKPRDGVIDRLSKEQEKQQKEITKKDGLLQEIVKKVVIKR